MLRQTMPGKSRGLYAERPGFYPALGGFTQDFTVASNSVPEPGTKFFGL